MTANADTPSTYCNPINVNYRFRGEDGKAWREAADPCVIIYKGDYYLFASKSGGYWWSTDMYHWQFVPITDQLPIEAYAPTAEIIDGELYWMASETALYRSTDPKAGEWEKLSDWETGYDPAIFLDDDGKVYLYWGCAQMGPIEGVELDLSVDGIGKSEPFICLRGNPTDHGWERREIDPWVEGAWMTKHEGRYYLQYAAPGTEFDIYADGVYVADDPKGPFVYQDYSPISYKPRGFINGAGHGCTFKDKNGNYWRALTLSISVLHPFERRIALYPAGFDQDGIMFTHTAYGDYPHHYAQAFTDWMLLSYKKAATASSSAEGHGPELAVDEQVRTYWSAETTNPDEWLTVDLGNVCTVYAIQANFAEHPQNLIPAESVQHTYTIAVSTDGETFKNIVDRSDQEADAAHDYIELEKPIEARYVKIIHKGSRFASLNFALRGLRIFGRAPGVAPATPEDIHVMREDDERDATASWQRVSGAEGYVVYVGTKPDSLYHSFMVYDDAELHIPTLNKGVTYFVAVEAFNASGRSARSEPVRVK